MIQLKNVEEFYIAVVIRHGR